MIQATTDARDQTAETRKRRKLRVIFVLAIDLLVWPIALSAAYIFYGRGPTNPPSILLIALAMIAQFVIGRASGLYRGHFRRFSFDEAGAVAITAGGTGVILILAEFLTENAARAGQIIVIATSIAVCLMFTHRYVRRMRAERAEAASRAHLTPVIVYGAGEGGYRAIGAMQTVSSSRYRPVALVDDDPALRNRRIGGLRVEGTSDDLAHIARHHDAHSVLLALPSASGEELRRLHKVVQAAGLESLVMPPVQRLVGEGSPREITRYRDEDVLNRRIVDIDPETVGSLVSGSRVLVTGAGGSIGSELIRQLAAFRPSTLVALDHDDSLLHHVIASLPAESRSICTPALADIRDLDRLHQVFAQHRPELVFHAAALKHVPALESAPCEGWKTNVLGSANVLTACERAEVSRVVNISTDKAANPENVLGYTKRVAERLTAASAARTQRPYVSVRFGNVIGSRGSAIETFERQIAQGGPVTITDRDVTRYFMAVREAVRLTMQAAAIGRPGEVLVLDMGTPVRVDDVARQLIDRSGHPIEIEYTGLRPGEKLHEVLLGSEERAERPLHPMIDHVNVPPLDLSDGIHACAAADVDPATLEGLAIVIVSPEPANAANVRSLPTGLSLRRTS